MKTWFTSDTHFNHTNIIQYCQRPFVLADPLKCARCRGTGVRTGGNEDFDQPPDACVHPDIDAMNEELVLRWNSRVLPEDTVFHLGDLFLGPSSLAKPILRRLNGIITLVKGNHDRVPNPVFRALGFEPVKRAHITMGQHRILLEHNPRYMDLTNYDFGLCGHVHGAWKEKVVAGKRVINVGVDVRGFRPVSLEELVGDLWNR